MSRYLIDRIAALPNVEVADRDRGHAASKARTACSRPIRWRTGDGEETRRELGTPVPVHRRRAQHRLAAAPASRSTTRASC